MTRKENIIIFQDNHEDLSSIYSIMFSGDNVTYTCPFGYIFNGSNDITFTASCNNKTWTSNFDQAKQCIRKYLKIFF